VGNSNTYGDAVEIRSRTSGHTWTFQPGQEADLRRDPAAAVPLENPKVSRTGHARLIWEGAVPVLVNDGDTRGIFANGTRQTRVQITSRVVVRLGTVEDGEDIELNTIPATVPLTPPVALPGDRRRPGGPPHLPGPDEHTAPSGAYAAPDQQVTQVPDGTGPTGPSLTVTCGTVTKTLVGEVGRTYLLGRSAAADIAVADDGVSRNHLRLRWDSAAWTVTDTSSRGTYRAEGGAPLPPGQAVVIDDVLALRLGSASVGTHVTLAPAGAGAGAGRRSKWVLPTIAAASVLVVIAAVGVVATALRGGDGGGGGDNTVSRATIAKAKPSVVRISANNNDGTGWGGSGTIISSDGLILTNAHVADPDAVGLIGQYGIQQSDPDAADPDEFLIGITKKADEPADDLYRAELLVSDGYLDLAVLKVTENVDGTPLDGELSLPALPIGDSDKVRGGDPMDLLGFPGASESDSITVTPGAASAPVNDKHLSTDRAWFDSTASQRHGNSGGTALSADGELIGIPTRGGTDASGDESERVRPVNWAKDIIAIAKKGGDPNYESPWVRDLSGTEEAEYASAGDTACPPPGAASSSVAAGTAFGVSFRYSGAQKNLDLYPMIGEVNAERTGVDPIIEKPGSWPASSEDDGCVFIEYSPSMGNLQGQYEAALYAGPNGDELLAHAPIVIGQPAP